MNLFAYTNQATLPTEDRVGGYTLPPTDIYELTVKALYMLPKDNGGIGVHLIGSIPVNGSVQEVNYTFHAITPDKDANGNIVKDAQGKPVVSNTYLNKKTGKPEYNPDFMLVDTISRLLTNQPLGAHQTSPIILELMDYDAKQKKPKQVQAWTMFQNEKLLIANQRIVKSKMQLVGTEYVATAETKQEIKAAAFMDLTTRRTVNEIEKQIAEPVYADAWVKQWAGKDRDETKKAAANKPMGSAGTAGLPTLTGAVVNNGAGQFE